MRVGLCVWIPLSAWQRLEWQEAAHSPPPPPLSPQNRSHKMLARCSTLTHRAAGRMSLPAVSRVNRLSAARGLSAKAMTPDEAMSAPTTTEDAGPNRFVVTGEVLVSKIFPAGFGWQAASVVAGQQGYEADSLAFALTTGAGDFAGVLAGHSAYSVLKNMTGNGGGMKNDLVAGLWLATAAFCSGTAWQPTVNFLHDAAGCNWMQTAVGCGAVTGACFFGGLRAGRVLFAPLGLPGADYPNLCGDALLSVSIGAATGTFVGTDITFVDNPLVSIFGVTDNMSDVEGMVRAGSSTFAGFLCMQSLQNVLLPKNANWIDPVKF